MADPTGFITNASGYINTDLSSIFAPKFPCNSDYGTVNFRATNPSSIYYNMEGLTKLSSNLNNIVNVGSGGSYFEFLRSGIYNLKLSYKLINIKSSSGNVPTGLTCLMNMRFNHTDTRDINDDPEVNYYYVENNGNYITNATNGSITSGSPNNLISMYYNNSNNGGYPVFQSSYYSNTAANSVTPTVNCYSLSITFEIDDVNKYLYPQYYINVNNSNLTWNWNGNWVMTKLYDYNSTASLNTNYIISNNDLVSKFASIYPLNIDYGTVIFSKNNPYSTNSYNNMYNINANSFNKTTNNNIVNVGIISGASYFQFIGSNKTVYNLTMSYYLDNISATASGNAITPTMHMRLCDINNNTSDTYIPIFNHPNFINLSNNGNSVNSTTTSNVVSLCQNNLLEYYNYYGDYPVFTSKYYFSTIQGNTTGVVNAPRKNLFTLSITFIPTTTTTTTTTTLNIYPQYYIDNINNANYTWTWKGNWIVTKLSG